ncbi:hypothetical protein CHLNCDRAFT_35599 [Chlorella variabilis]|uniref:Uncharacterized protein n=1 Tax=Chlorella variabilis TaxID=554065 RepID=E1ZFR6_CHLVA|nr:hypothetical protein CHLNCDRAFT_35599 [Chlorella variabilis]EFN55177.1 hypothetical protein CHLNCDRAFT_35599 [Chlorella variabilis]|eukprot:XP_005847279.1 hypothetical protein CHLNCDRAFT_35599 [Chlorella variabilis]
MLQSRSFVKKTKKGKVLKVVREHYLRDDIYSGTPLDPECPPEAYKLSGDAPHYLLVDTNVVLHQMDLLEHPAVSDVVVSSVVLEEVKARNAAVYQRLRQLIAAPDKRFFVFANEHHRETYIQQEPGESPNDRNDRALRVAAAWYTRRLPAHTVILLTDDADNRRKAADAGVEALGSAAYARQRAAEQPELQDLVAAAAAARDGEEDGAGHGAGAGVAGKGAARAAKRQRVYEEHRLMSDIAAGMKAGRYHQGMLRVNRFNSFEGWVGSESVGQDILISGRIDMNRAMEGDVVAVELLPEEQWRGPSNKLPSGAAAAGDASTAAEAEEVAEEAPEGAHIAQASAMVAARWRPVAAACCKVVGIIRRNWRTRGYCGSLQPPKSGPSGSANHTHSLLFCPVERRFPYIRIQTRQAATLADKRLVVAIDCWEADSLYPSGHYVRTLGAIGDKETETEVLLIENDINTSPFTAAVHACVPPLPWAVSEADLSDPSRADLRHLAVCSVDPPGCKDIDDALHVRRLPSGSYELGVHIADVTNFVHPATAMDEEASARATTVYLVQRRIDMLPKPLTEDICSLRADVERLAFSVIWEVTPEAEVVSSQFTKSVIRSRAALTYAEAQSRIDDARLTDELSINLRTLNQLAKILRQKRADRGALQLASPEVKFEIDTETHDPLDVGMYQVREANQMVEEMMLLANCTVAEFTLRHFPSCALLRRHPVPPPRQFEPLLRAAAAAGISIDPSTSKARRLGGAATPARCPPPASDPAQSLDRAVRADDPYFNKLIRIMATRCMTTAVYLSSGELSAPEYHHYGLAAPLYTHFTSPIRRYADVIVHRVLMAALGLRPLPESLRDRELMHGVVDNLNVRHRNAQMAGRASVELHTLIFFRSRQVVADARVRANGLIVFVPKYGIEGPVYLDDDDDAAAAAADGGGGEGPGSTASGAHSAGGRPGQGRKGGAAAAADGKYVYDEEQQTVRSRDGATRYTVFDKCAVRICVEEAAGNRRQLVLRLVPRSELAAAEQMH